MIELSEFFFFQPKAALGVPLNSVGSEMWIRNQGTGSQIVGFSNTASNGGEQFVGFEQFIVAINTTGVDLTKVSLTGLSGASVTDGYLMVDLI